MSSSIATFVGTTHEKHWIFTPERIAQLRSEANKRAADAVREAATRGPEMVGPSPNKRARTNTNIYVESPGAAGASESVVDCLTVAEENNLRYYFLSELQNMSRDTLKLPLSVEATALAYFQRFYLKNSVMEYHPQDIMLTALWVACKVEHYPNRFLTPEKIKVGDSNREFVFDAKAFAYLATTKGMEVGLDDLIGLEQVLLQSLDYHFMVFHPYRALRGLVESWSEFIRGEGDMRKEDEATLLDKGEHRLREFLKSDLALIYHPAELAIKALQASVKSQDKEGASSSSLKQKLDDFLNDVFGSQQAELGRLAKVCKEIESDGKAFSKQLLKGEKLEAEATRIMAKLKDCCNPATERRHPWHVQIKNAKRLERERIKQEKICKQAEEQRLRQSELLGNARP